MYKIHQDSEELLPLEVPAEAGSMWANVANLPLVREGTAYVMNIWGGCGNRMQYEMLQIVADSCFALAREEGKLLYTCVMLCAFYLTGIIWTERLQMACTDRGRWLLPQETLYCAGPVEAMQGYATYQAIRAFGAFGDLVDLGRKLALKMNGEILYCSIPMISHHTTTYIFTGISTSKLGIGWTWFVRSAEAQNERGSWILSGLLWVFNAFQPAPQTCNSTISTARHLRRIEPVAWIDELGVGLYHLQGGQTWAWLINIYQPWLCGTLWYCVDVYILLVHVNTKGPKGSNLDVIKIGKEQNFVPSRVII